jgi:hypothetical protein
MPFACDAVGAFTVPLRLARPKAEISLIGNRSTPPLDHPPATSPPPVAQHKVCARSIHGGTAVGCQGVRGASTCIVSLAPSPRTGRNETHKRVVWELGGARRQKAVVATTEPGRLCGIPNHGWTRCPVRRHRQRAPESGYPLPVTLLGSL